MKKLILLLTLCFTVQSDNLLALSPKTITLGGSLTTAASTGAAIYCYLKTTKLEKALNGSSAKLMQSSNINLDEYFENLKTKRKLYKTLTWVFAGTAITGLLATTKGCLDWYHDGAWKWSNEAGCYCKKIATHPITEKPIYLLDPDDGNYLIRTGDLGKTEDTVLDTEKLDKFYKQLHKELTVNKEVGAWQIKQSIDALKQLAKKQKPSYEELIALQYYLAKILRSAHNTAQNNAPAHKRSKTT